MKKPLSIVSIGAGNLAFNLIPAIKNAGHSIVQVWSRTKKSANALARRVDANSIISVDDISKTADLYIVSLPDEIIPNSIKSFNLKNVSGLVVHTSGSTESFNTTQLRTGIFYPLQSFNKKDAVDFKTIPIFINANSKKDLSLLRKLGKLLSKRVIVLSDEQRRELHLSAVIINNFIHHLAYKSKSLLKDHDLRYSYLDALLAKTILNIGKKNLFDLQTGPAKRGDNKTILAHNKLLKSDPELKSIYNAISKSITKTYL